MLWEQALSAVLILVQLRMSGAHMRFGSLRPDASSVVLPRSRRGLGVEPAESVDQGFGLGAFHTVSPLSIDEPLRPFQAIIALSATETTPVEYNIVHVRTPAIVDPAGPQ